MAAWVHRAEAANPFDGGPEEVTRAGDTGGAGPVRRGSAADPQEPDAARSYIILLCMIVFVGFQQCCISTVTWLLLSEIFPLRIRGFAMGVAVFVLWAVDFAISLLFPS